MQKNFPKKRQSIRLVTSSKYNERNIRALILRQLPIFFNRRQGWQCTNFKSCIKGSLPHQDKPAGTILSADKKWHSIATVDGVLNLLPIATCR